MNMNSGTLQSVDMILCLNLDTIWRWLMSSMFVPLSGSYWRFRSHLDSIFASIGLLFWIYIKFAFFQRLILMAGKFWIFLLFWDQKGKSLAIASSLSHLGLLSRGCRMSVSKLTDPSSTGVWWIFVAESQILVRFLYNGYRGPFARLLFSVWHRS